MDIELPDGKTLTLPDGATGADAAAAIGPGLARAALAVKVQGEIRDMARPLPESDGAPEKLAILTDRSGQEALELIRHDTAHVLAAAVMELYPGVKISIGPPIENGFYYDFDFPDGVSVSDADFERIEAKMREHIAADEPFVREDVPVAEALERFRSEAQDYKVELIEDLVRDQHVETVSLYTNGPFTDLCRGPHAPSTSRIKAFKLQSVAGAYWRGDSNRPMLTRVYGTAFFSKQALAEHLERLERARANDHRRLGPQLNMFMFSDVAPGSRPGPTCSTRSWRSVVRWDAHAATPRSRRRCCSIARSG
jgi:threonyl-tRNA synthetase